MGVVGEIQDPGFWELVCKEMFEQVDSSGLGELMMLGRIRPLGLSSFPCVVRMRTKTRNGDDPTLRSARVQSNN